MRQKSIDEYFQKQQKHRSEQNTQSFEMICSPLLGKHLQCNEFCLSFKPKICNICKNQVQVSQIQSLLIKECFNIISKQVKQREKQIKRTQIKKNKKRFRKYRQQNLQMKKRIEIQNLQNLGYKNSVIAALLNCSPAQVRKNQIYIQQQKRTHEIIFTPQQLDWIKEQAMQESNSLMFSAQLLMNRFKEIFISHNKLSLFQFRKLLSSLNLHYKAPQTKPLPYFNKNRNMEVINFIQKLCAYIKQNYKLIYVDECSLGCISKNSQKQWLLQGSFKHQIHRVSSYYCMIAALGQDDFLRYQIISGSGNAFIFHDFLLSLLEAANQHYRFQKFVIILDNCQIHKANLSSELLGSIQHVFTPPYRPEFNCIENLFGWLKRKVSAAQPMIMCQFLYQIHNVLNSTTCKMIDSWCKSNQKHMLLFMENFLKQDSGLLLQ